MSNIEAHDATDESPNASREISLKEILLLERKRREQSKQIFLFSSTPSSIASISPTPSVKFSLPTTNTTIATTTSATATNQTPPGEATDELTEENTANDDSAIQMTTPTITQSSHKYLKHATKPSPVTAAASTSSLHLSYGNILRKIQLHGKRRKHIASNTDDDEYDVDDDDDDDEEDGGVCDISACEDISDEYDNCDISLKKRQEAAAGGRRGTKKCACGNRSTDYQADGSFYETSDTGGEMTTADDIDSSMNLISNISYNSSNSNTSSLEKSRSGLIVSSKTSPQTVKLPQATKKTAAIAKVTKSILSHKLGKSSDKSKSKVRAGGGGLSSPNSSDLSSASPVPAQSTHLLAPVARSRSFQEPGVKTRPRASSPTRHKKYTRFFQRRRSKRSKGRAAKHKSDFGLDRLAAQNIEITIQDEDGNYQQYDDNFCALSAATAAGGADDDLGQSDGEVECLDYDHYLDDRPHSCGSADSHQSLCLGHTAGLSDDAAADESDGDGSHSHAFDNEHLFGRLLRRVQRLSLGWRKPRYHKRRGDFLP